MQASVNAAIGGRDTAFLATSASRRAGKENLNKTETLQPRPLVPFQYLSATL
jgi:hypothetical protein